MRGPRGHINAVRRPRLQFEGRSVDTWRMRPAGRFATVAIVLLLGVAAAGAHPSAAAALAARSGCTTSTSPATDKASPFDGVCDYLDGRDGVVQAAVFDEKTGRTYVLSNGDSPQYTASIVKVDILAKWLHHLQGHRVQIPGDIPYSIRFLMERMIENSDNAATTALFHFGGGCDALTRFDRLIPLTGTKVGCESPTYYGWGNTTTSAADQAAVMRLFAYGHPRHILGPDARSYGRHLMENVEPDQRFGITCGPWGTSCDPPDYAQPVPGVTVALKNGWKTLPTCSQPIAQCPWQVNSTGWVEGQGRNYVLSILTTHDPVGTGGLYGFNYGIDTIQSVSERVWHNLN
jgi:hypothetical protein